VSLAVYTARVASRDVDRLDITRKSAPPEGVVFAPSWKILGPALEALQAAKRAPKHEAGRIAFDAWADYVPAYRVEMRESYKRHRATWDALLERPRVVLCCYCVDPCRCHRMLLARFILPRLGAVYRGEVLS